ncbi:MAG: Gfo/Idh/MocA family oxidoreductase [Candidatus Bathyarchaeota archaeon]|nr:Gfo/Idh/MocA family oxidoreductase [Candidatus Bathyarchaeota archaeon]
MIDVERLNIALIGCGGIANLHVNGYKDLHTRGLRTFEIKAVCDKVTDNAKVKADAIGHFQGAKPRIYLELDELLENESLDAVDLCLPHNVHHNVASRFLEEDLHVIIEKPLGITMRAAKSIIAEAEKHGKILAVAENYRRSPENRTIWWTIRQGLIGKPRMIVWAAAGWNSQPWGWREDKLISGGSWVFDGGVHLADLDRYHLGEEAVEVYSVNDTFEPLKKGVKVTVDDMTMAIIRYEDRAYAQWLWTRVAPAKRIGMRVIYGSKGTITNEDVQIQKEDCTEIYGLGTLRRRMMESLSHEESQRWFPNGATDTFATELYDFYDSIMNGRKPEVDGWEAYKDMAIPIGFYESAVLGKPVKIEDIEGLKVEEYQAEINEKLGLKD